MGSWRSVISRRKCFRPLKLNAENLCWFGDGNQASILCCMSGAVSMQWIPPPFPPPAGAPSRRQHHHHHHHSLGLTPHSPSYLAARLLQTPKQGSSSVRHPSSGASQSQSWATPQLQTTMHFQCNDWSSELTLGPVQVARPYIRKGVGMEAKEEMAGGGEESPMEGVLPPLRGNKQRLRVEAQLSFYCPPW